MLEPMTLISIPVQGGEPDWVEEVLRFWFVELSAGQWFKKDASADARIRERFLPIRQQLLASDAVGIVGPRPLLAAVLVLDQFSRNMFRHDPRAFTADPLARRISTEAIAQGFDRAMSREERLFLYMPFQHSEDRADQARSIELARTLDNDNWTRFALAHKQLIDRFGRFPHRNAVLGRESTPAETEMLKDPGASF